MFGLALGRATNGGKPVAHEQAVLARLGPTRTQFSVQSNRFDDEGGPSYRSLPGGI